MEKFTIIGSKTIDGDGKVSDVLYTIGTALESILWKSAALPEIRAQAKKLAIFLLERSEENL